MKKLITFLLAVALTSMVSANNITVTNILLTGQNTDSEYTMVQFDLSWENSWRTSSAPNNWDAAWVFVKYRVTDENGGDGLWHHASLNNVGHTAPSGSTIDIGLLTPATDFNATTNPGLGTFIYRSANGTGTNSFTGAQLRWNYGVNYSTGETPIGDNDIIDIQVFAIEMVYVPSGNFYVGSGGTELSSFTTANNTFGATVPFQITSTAPTIQGNNAGSNASNLSARGDFDLTGTTTAALATGYPTGYNAFYNMKYEISQQGYVDFLNSLTRAQQDTRTNTSLASGTTSVSNRYVMSNAFYISTRNGIACNETIDATASITFYCDLNNNATGSEASDGQCIASVFLTWPDVAAYLDWSGLRPMTELEFEKACRGTLVVANEFAWGGISATQSTGITSSGLTNETSTNTGNATYGTHVSVPGPMRVGAFATSSSTRVSAGATYYGIMEMSGNVAERLVTVGNSTGRAFTGTHGNGVLDATGNADATTWPSTDGVGAGIRGGSWTSWASPPAFLRVSDRDNATYYTISTSHLADVGGRGVRTAPSLFIGQSYGGGIIFYIDGTGLHGLIAAASDQGYVVWGCYLTAIPGAYGTAIGTGNQNTTNIIAACPTSAAGLCGSYTNLETGTGVYSDWFLPSIDELYTLFLARAVFDVFNSSHYWSSSQWGVTPDYHAQTVGFEGTGKGYRNKQFRMRVRAVRSF